MKQSRSAAHVGHKICVERAFAFLIPALPIFRSFPLSTPAYCEIFISPSNYFRKSWLSYYFFSKTFCVLSLAKMTPIRSGIGKKWVIPLWGINTLWNYSFGKLWLSSLHFGEGGDNLPEGGRVWKRPQSRAVTFFSWCFWKNFVVRQNDFRNWRTLTVSNFPKFWSLFRKTYKMYLGNRIDNSENAEV